jgi:MFS family permease
MLAGLVLQSIMALIDVSMFIVAIPSIQNEYALPVDGNIPLFYSFVAMIGFLLGCFLSDRWISRKVDSFGLFILATGIAWLGWIVSGVNPFTLMPGIILCTLGAVLLLFAITKEAVASLSDDKVELASEL